MEAPEEAASARIQTQEQINASITTRYATQVIVVGSSFVADGARFREITLPSLERALDQVDVVLSSTGDARGIAAVYNDFVREARTRPDCEALILLHDDVEIVDANFRAKVLAAIAEEGVGVVGTVGGTDLRSVEWWRARRTAGRTFETRGPIELGPPRADVDVVDGFFLAISPRAFQGNMFDEEACPRFHGYDVDYCLQVRAAGLRVTVRPIEVLHRTKGGYGDKAAFNEAADAVAAKWPTRIRPPRRSERARSLPTTVRGSIQKHGRRLKRFVGSTWPGTTSTIGAVAMVGATASADLPRGYACLACGEPFSPEAYQRLDGPQAVVCGECGSGLTWPQPGRVVEGDGLWADRYGDRLARRGTWFSEGRKRVEWLQLFLPEGCLLEIGCGTGEFIKVAEDEGYDVFGVEPSHWAAQHAHALGLPVETGFLSDWIARYPGLRPNAVCLWHVLEHVPEPLAFLQEVCAILKPGGYVFLEVPNFASSAAGRLGMAWDAAQPADHFAQYTPYGLARLLSRAGLERIQLLPMTQRIYASDASWRVERNAALLERHDWPPLDLLRGVARSRMTQ